MNHDTLNPITILVPMNVDQAYDYINFLEREAEYYEGEDEEKWQEYQDRIAEIRALEQAATK